MGQIQRGIITNVTDTDFRDAMTGKPLDVSDSIKRRIAQQANVSMLNQQYFNPFWEPSTMEIPKDRRKINAWCRYFFDSDPIVHAALSLHSEFPISGIGIEHPDPEIKEFLQDMLQDLEMIELLANIALEYFIIGECFISGILDDPEEPTKWDKFILMDPDYMDVYSIPFARRGEDKRINMIPSAALEKIVTNGPNDPNTGDLYMNLPKDVIDNILTRTPLTMDPMTTSHIKCLGNYHNERGTPLMMCCFKALMYKDKLRSAQYAIADRHVTPKEFYLIGETGDPASSDEISAFRDVLTSTWNQPNQAIVYHHALRIEMIGSSGKILPLQAEFDDIEKQVLAGLMSSRAFIHGEGPSYSSSAVALDVLISRYIFFRQRLENWINKCVFAPIMRLYGMYKPNYSELTNRYRIKQHNRPLWLPTITWERNNLRDDVQRGQLLQGLYDKGLIPAGMLLKYFNIDPETALRGIEAEKGTAFDKNKKEGESNMGLNGEIDGDLGGGDLGGGDLGMSDLGSAGEDTGNNPIGPEAPIAPNEAPSEMPPAGGGAEGSGLTLPMGI